MLLMKSNKKKPLFIISGAWGIGKSTISEKLCGKGKKYIVLDGSEFCNFYHDTAYYRKLWSDLCYSISSQLCLPIVFYASLTPDNLEHIDENIFSEIHYIYIVSDEETLRNRMKSKKNKYENWMEGSVLFNTWLINNAESTIHKMHLLDTTAMTAEEAANIVDKWILERIV